ncbi:MAG: diacylglycerol kinase family lipid kinase [Nitrospirae bacterium]|nr:diacylglycerol kinase family lipid kinase [Nitrospirota bacterium]
MNSLITIICNPAARGSSMKKIGLARTFLMQKGFGTELLLTERGGHAQSLAEAALAKKPFRIIAAGGDGTINEVMNGMIGSDTPLAILPMGTTNVLAKELGISENIHQALETAVTASPKTVSPGKIDLGMPVSLSRYFCLMAGVGFDGKAVHDVNLRMKKISGEAAYIQSGLKNLIFYAPDEIGFVVDGREYSGYSAIIGKASKYGGNFRITPDANLPDPAFHLCIFKGRKRADLLRYVFGVIRGGHLKFRDVVYLRAKDIGIQGAPHIQIDGDYLGTGPARLTVAEDCLRLVY